MSALNHIQKTTVLSVLALGAANLFAAAPKPVDPSKFDRPVRVACIGDGVTQGVGVGATTDLSFPSQLQQLLGEQWVVANFGIRARTLLSQGNLPLRHDPAFQDAQDFQPDVVIITLGVGDDKPYNGVHDSGFYSDYSDVVDVCARLPGPPRIYICRPCPVPKPSSDGISRANIRREIPLIDKLARRKGLGVIDVPAALADHPELLHDCVHPNDDGASLMAEAAFTALTGKAAPPSVNSYFADHAVLQRCAANPVWGTAAEGDRITVKFAGQTVSAVAMDGRWKVVLQPMNANAEPQTMTISNGRGGVRTIHDVLVGDVWVASGQSNMERQLGPRAGQQEIVGWREAAAKADYPLIRQYQLPQVTSAKPLPDGRGEWKVCSPETAADFCAVGFFFIRDIYAAQQVPLALLHSTWGGTPAEAWTSVQALKTLPEYAAKAKIMEQLARDPSLLDELREKWMEDNDKGTMKAWWKESIASKGWQELQAPASYDEMGIHNFNGVVWFRKTFDLSADAVGQQAILHLQKIDDSDSTWVNGTLVGKTDGWQAMRNYAVPAGVLKPGRNVVAIRTLDTGGGGGWSAGSSELSLEFQDGPATESVSLSGSWQGQVGASLAAGSELSLQGAMDQNPSVLFNAMIHPLLPLRIKGVIWYQGEANNYRADAYADLFSTLIEDWRARWNCGDFPFLFVQIAPNWEMTPELRESQRLVLAREPNTAMAVTVDVGDARDIHPTRKEPVGQRLALAGRALAYGEKIEYSGPLYESMTIKDDCAILHFTHVGQGLEAKGGELRGFEVAGADGVFVPAQAKIDGETIVVSSDQVTAPVTVRYGWANVPDVNLFNKDGLPASPFTTASDW